jgi:hypothetical protein
MPCWWPNHLIDWLQVPIGLISWVNIAIAISGNFDKFLCENMVLFLKTYASDFGLMVRGLS